MEDRLTVDNKKLLTLNIKNRSPSSFILLNQCHELVTSFLFLPVLRES